MKAKLPVISIFLEALSLPITHYQRLIKIALPLIFIGLLHIILTYVVFELEAVNQVERWIYTGLYIVGLLTFLLFLITAIVGCHRIFLSHCDNQLTFFNWTGNEIKYIGWWLLITLWVVPVGVIFQYLITPFILYVLLKELEYPALMILILALMNIPIIYVFSRLSLVLPSCAVGIHKKGLKWSWKLSSENSWRLTLLIGFLPGIMNVISYLWGQSSIRDLLLVNDSFIGVRLIEGSIWLILGVIEVGMLSLSYKFLINNQEQC